MDDMLFSFATDGPFLVGTLLLGFAGLISGKLQKDK